MVQRFFFHLNSVPLTKMLFLKFFAVLGFCFGLVSSGGETYEPVPSFIIPRAIFEATTSDITTPKTTKAWHPNDYDK